MFAIGTTTGPYHCSATALARDRQKSAADATKNSLATNGEHFLNGNSFSLECSRLRATLEMWNRSRRSRGIKVPYERYRSGRNTSRRSTQPREYRIAECNANVCNECYLVVAAGMLIMIYRTQSIDLSIRVE